MPARGVDGHPAQAGDRVAYERVLADSLVLIRNVARTCRGHRDRGERGDGWTAVVTALM